jgi:hypothetical protein
VDELQVEMNIPDPDDVGGRSEQTEAEMDLLEGSRAVLGTKDRNDLPDSAFAFIEGGGTKDADGKTTPRDKRHFPIHDKVHVENALSRIGQGAKFGDEAKPKVLAAAKKFKVDASDDKRSESTHDDLMAQLTERLGA